MRLLLQRMATVAYIEALQQLQPPLGAGVSYDAVAPRLEGAGLFATLPERKRRQVFAAYVDALAGAERVQQADHVQAQRAVQEQQAQQQAAQQAVQHLQREAQRATVQRQAQQAEREAQHATAWQREEDRHLAEAGFRQLLETQEELIQSGAPWAVVAAKLAEDARWVDGWLADV